MKQNSKTKSIETLNKNSKVLPANKLSKKSIMKPFHVKREINIIKNKNFKELISKKNNINTSNANEKQKAIQTKTKISNISNNKIEGNENNQINIEKIENNIEEIKVNNKYLQSLKEKIFSPDDDIATPLDNGSKNQKILLELSKKFMESTLLLTKLNKNTGQSKSNVNIVVNQNNNINIINNNIINTESSPLKTSNNSPTLTETNQIANKDNQVNNIIINSPIEPSINIMPPSSFLNNTKPLNTDSNINNRNIKQSRSIPFNTLEIKPTSFLPEMSPQNKDKKTLILDLDETLVHSQFKPFYFQSDILLNIMFEGNMQKIYVLKRPYVDEFLTKMSKYYEIVIFTASIEEYANALLDQLDTNNVVSYRLFRQHCLKANSHFIKDISKVGRELKNSIIIDNNPISYILNKDNGIPILTWHNNKSDNELLKLIPLLEYMSNVSDVRECIKKITNGNYVNFREVDKLINSNSTCNENNNLKRNIKDLDCDLNININNKNDLINNSNYRNKKGQFFSLDFDHMKKDMNKDDYSNTIGCFAKYEKNNTIAGCENKSSHITKDYKNSPTSITINLNNTHKQTIHKKQYSDNEISSSFNDMNLLKEKYYIRNKNKDKLFFNSIDNSNSNSNLFTRDYKTMQNESHQKTLLSFDKFDTTSRQNDINSKEVIYDFNSLSTSNRKENKSKYKIIDFYGEETETTTNKVGKNIITPYNANTSNDYTNKKKSEEIVLPSNDYLIGTQNKKKQIIKTIYNRINKSKSKTKYQNDELTSNNNLTNSAKSGKLKYNYSNNYNVINKKDMLFGNINNIGNSKNLFGNTNYLSKNTNINDYDYSNSNFNSVNKTSSSVSRNISVNNWDKDIKNKLFQFDKSESIDTKRLKWGINDSNKMKLNTNDGLTAYKEYNNINYNINNNILFNNHHRKNISRQSLYSDIFSIQELITNPYEKFSPFHKKKLTLMEQIPHSYRKRINTDI